MGKKLLTNIVLLLTGEGKRPAEDELGLECPAAEAYLSAEEARCKLCEGIFG